MNDRSNWQKQFSLGIKPDETDTSPYDYVIERKEFKEMEEGSGNWEYLERWVPKTVWIADRLKEQKEVNDALMLGLVDLYELQLGV